MHQFDDDEEFANQLRVEYRLTAYTNLEVPYRKRDDNHELVVTVYSEERLSNVHTDEQILVLAHGRDWLRSMDNRVEIRLDVNLSWQIAKL